MNVLKSTSSSYVQNMIENMNLTSYLDWSYLVASWGGYVTSIQIMSRDNLKYQVDQQCLSPDKFMLSHDISFMSHQRLQLQYTITEKHLDTARHIFSLINCVNCEVLRHAEKFFLLHSAGILQNTYSMKTYFLLHWTQKWRLVAL